MSIQYVTLMSRGDEIRKAREAKGLSQVALAKAIGISQSAVNKIEQGETVKSKWLPEIEAYLKMAPPPADGAYRPPPAFFSSDRNMPVFAAAEGGNGFMIIETEPIEHVPRPYTLAGISEAYGILITGESMVPAYEPGDTAWVNPRLPPIRDVDVILYELDGHGEAKASIKRLVSWTETEWELKQHNPPKTFKLKRREWPKCHRVVGKFSRR